MPPKSIVDEAMSFRKMVVWGINILTDKIADNDGGWEIAIIPIPQNQITGGLKVFVGYPCPLLLCHLCVLLNFIVMDLP